LVIFPHLTLASPLGAKLEQTVRGAGWRVGVAVISLDGGDDVVGFHSAEPLIPASVLKILTSYTALKELGPDYRFETELFAERKSATLFLRGGGDPVLTSERLWGVAEDVHHAGIERVDTIVLDSSSFFEERKRSGGEPYQAEQSALALNFNSLVVEITPTTRGRAAEIATNLGAPLSFRGEVKTVAGEKSEISLSTVEGNGGERWTLAVRGTIGELAAPYVDYRSVPSAEQYFGAVFKWMLERSGVDARNAAVRKGLVNSSLERIALYRSRELAPIVYDLNHLSTNFVANQLVYALGATSDTERSFARGLERISRFAERLRLGAVELYDGSGLDRNNRLSAAQLARVLQMAARDFAVAPELMASLGQYGRSGTLRRRNLNHPLSDKVRAKTGSLSGVSSLAGYIEARSGRRYAFAVISNDLKTQSAWSLEDKIVRLVLDDG
jgi:serine-type D-Ala-D-Ala carboxypeptidase/endopeptidase (penicillin-binding protein 4)